MVLNINDDDDRMLELLTTIAKNTGGLDDLDDLGSVQQDITIESNGVTKRVGTMKPRSYIVVETASQDGANDDGTVTVNPGETVRMVSYKGDPFAVLAAGAHNEQGVQYILRVDDEKPAGGPTQSPLGGINSPFSFVDELGGAIACEKRIEYLARLDGDASSPVDVAARLHIEVIK